jgi:hypothetical protein
LLLGDVAVTVWSCDANDDVACLRAFVGDCDANSGPISDARNASETELLEADDHLFVSGASHAAHAWTKLDEIALSFFCCWLRIGDIGWFRWIVLRVRWGLRERESEHKKQRRAGSQRDDEAHALRHDALIC